MKTVQWVQDLRFDLDPNDVEDFVLNFTAWLEGALASGATVSQVGSATASVSVHEWTTAGMVSIRVSSGTAGEVARVTVNLTAVGGRVIERSFLVRFIQL